MLGLTDRQLEILRAVIKEYMENADEVGSTLLVKKYDLGVSSATVRNEMVKLMKEGYLEKSHISSGRIPTDQAFRLYVKELVEMNNGDILAFVEVKQNLFRARFDENKLVRTILEVLSDNADSASFAITSKYIRYYGVSRLMNYEELKRMKVLRRILDILENEELLLQLVRSNSQEDISILIGEELGIDDLEECSFAFTSIPFWRNDELIFGVVGSRRLNYSTVLPLLRNVSESVKESLMGWM